MNVAVIYCYPMVLTRTHYPLARAFTNSWRSHDPGYPHTLTVGCNGMRPGTAELRPFDGLTYRTLVHDNLGWDIGLFQRAADEIPCDLLVCLGAHIRINHTGWLRKLVDAVADHGPGLYGPWGVEYPNHHIRTTAFACQPEILKSYPLVVGSDRPSRYQFEHGTQSITAHVLKLGFPAVMVTMNGSYPWPDWRDHTPTADESILLDKQHL